MCQRLGVRLTTAIEARLRGESRSTAPLVDVIVLETPRGGGS